MRLTWSLCVALTQLAVARAFATTPSPSLPECRSTNRVPPSCDFLTVCNYISYHEGSTNLSWVLASGPMKPLASLWRPPGSTDQSYYVYLDGKNGMPVGSKAMMSAEISHDVTAICVEFHYATNGINGKHNIRVLLQSTPGYGPSYRTDPVVFELKNFTTTYAWKMATFSTCLNGSRHISFESSTISGLEKVSIDGIKVTAADLPCEATTTVVTTSVTQPPCTATDLPSCDFQTLCNYVSYYEENSNLTWVLSNGTTRPIYANWKADPTDQSFYAFINPNGVSTVSHKALLSAHICEDLGAVHVEFHYVTIGNQKHNISVYLQSTPGYGPSYSSDNLVFELKDLSTSYQWRSANFTTCLEDKFYISFEGSATSGYQTVALDGIRVTRADMACPNSHVTSIPTTTPTTTAPSTTAVATSPSCTDPATDLPSCDFLTLCNYVSYHQGNTDISWKLADGDGRLTDQSHYVYLDNKSPAPLSSKAILSAPVCQAYDAIHVEFHYATNGMQNQSLRVLLQSTPGYGPNYETDRVVFELKDVNTAYQWRTASFTTCLEDTFHISFESSKISTVETMTLGGVQITRANMNCLIRPRFTYETTFSTTGRTSTTGITSTTGRISTTASTHRTTTTVTTLTTTYRIPTTTAPESTTLKTSNISGSPSCEFQTLCNYISYPGDNTDLTWVLADGPMKPIMNGWVRPGATEASSYVYMDVYTGAPVTSQALLSTHISQDLTAIHVEFRYATSGFHPHDMRVLLQSTPGYGPSYVTDRLVFELKDVNTAFTWRYASFSACLHGKYFISFESTKISGLETVALDSIQITSTGIDCSTDTQGN
ncbi:uncharacterized protein LOC131955302 [Physella acuta]|uniref:uncharacterized protein LOC131955302 n=1 Tax=Physella acuta TaxID=109671 RepID=UPI0027DB3598|nr:uncharacterized protein LOC131955302 [Physella acuta]